MVEFEADDALGRGGRRWRPPTRGSSRSIICTPDKDLGQCVSADGRIVQLDRRTGTVVRRARASRAKFGVPPESIPDYLALVGDSADGFPGLPGWGAKSAAAVLARYGHLEDIPAIDLNWEVDVRGAAQARRHPPRAFRRGAPVPANRHARAQRSRLGDRRGSALDRAGGAVRRAVRVARRAPPGPARRRPGCKPSPGRQVLIVTSPKIAGGCPALVRDSRRLHGGANCLVHAGSGSLP